MTCATFYLALAVMLHNGWIADGGFRFHRPHVQADTEYVEVHVSDDCHIRLIKLMPPGVPV